jgi:hypothetical protein
MNTVEKTRRIRNKMTEQGTRWAEDAPKYSFPASQTAAIQQSSDETKNEVVDIPDEI